MQTYGSTNCSVSGEIGIFETVFLSRVLVDKVYLLIHTDEGNTYIGSVVFEKASSAKAVFDLLYQQVNIPLALIGAIDVADNFGKEPAPK